MAVCLSVIFSTWSFQLYILRFLARALTLHSKDLIRDSPMAGHDEEASATSTEEISSGPYM